MILDNKRTCCGAKIMMITYLVDWSEAPFFIHLDQGVDLLLHNHKTY
jgi:hypothetical protein